MQGRHGYAKCSIVYMVGKEVVLCSLRQYNSGSVQKSRVGQAEFHQLH